MVAVFGKYQGTMRVEMVSHASIILSTVCSLNHLFPIQVGTSWSLYLNESGEVGLTVHAVHVVVVVGETRQLKVPHEHLSRFGFQGHDVEKLNVSN